MAPAETAAQQRAQVRDQLTRGHAAWVGLLACTTADELRAAIDQLDADQVRDAVVFAVAADQVTAGDVSDLADGLRDWERMRSADLA